jgi:hypothetical protein
MSPLRSLQRVLPFCARGIYLISCLTLFVCFSVSVAPVVAQEQPATDDEVLRVTTDLLLFPARVRDKNGKPNRLTEKDSFVRDVSSALGAFDLRAHDNQPTAIFDAAAHAVEMFKTLPRIRSERRIVILISDGLDNYSRAKPDSVINAARADRVSFYIIHLPLFEPRDGRLAVRRPPSGFRDLAEKTGGKYFLANDSPLAPRTTVDLTPIFEAIEEDLKSQYLIGFYLNEKANDGRRHNFSLSVPPGFEFQIPLRGYSRTQKLFVERPREALKPRS